MVNRGGIGDLLVGRKMAGLPTVQDVQTYAQGGETTIEMPHSLKELQNWNKTHPDKNLMDKIFTDRRVGVEGAEPIAMPANVDELTAFMKAKRQGYSHGGETKAMAHHLQSMGQDGDTILAHINPEEAGILKALGGSGKPNPHTGLPSFGVDNGPEAGATGSFSANRAAEAASVRGGDTVSGASTSFGGGGGGGGGGGRDESSYSGPISRFGTDVTNANIQATQPSTVSPSGNFDIYGRLGGGSDLISPAPAPSFTSTDFSADPFKGPYVSPLMTVARMQDNPASSTFNQKAMESLNPWFQTKSAALLDSMMDKGLTPYFSSGSRTVAQQADIYANPSPYGAAPPGMSAHNFGQAFDIGGLTNKQMIDAGLMAEAQGMGWGGRFATYDPVHFQEMPSSASPAKYAASVGVPMYKGVSVGGVETAGAPRPEPFDMGKAITDRLSSVFTPGGIGSLVLGAAVPPLGAYDLAANVVNMAGGTLPTTSNMINQGLGVPVAEPAQAPVVPPMQPSRPITPTPSTAVADIYTPAPASGPTTRGIYNPSVDYTSGGPTTRGVYTPASMQVADASGSIVPTQTAPAAPQEQGWWDKLFNNPEAVQKVLETENTYNPGYANTTSGLTKEEWASEMRVDPDTVKARITTMNGVPQVDWYTKGLDEALAEMVTGPFKAIGSALGFGKGTADATQVTPYIPTGGIGDHQTAVAQTMFGGFEEEIPPKKKSIYEIWPTDAEGYTGPYSKYIV